MIGYYNYTIILTYLGLMTGILGIYNAIEGKTIISIICLMLSGFCDMFDGIVARTKDRTDDEKRFGIQLDSLSDLICFGVLPTLIVYSSIGFNNPICMLIYIFYILSAYTRLAYFNVVEEKRQNVEKGARKEYEGLPVTIVALIVPLICLSKKYIGHPFPIVALMLLIIIGMCFITKFKLKKAKRDGMIALVIIGVLELILLILSRMGHTI